MNEYLLFIFTAFVILREFMCVNACVLTAPVCSVNPTHVCLFLHAALSLTHIPKLFNIKRANICFAHSLSACCIP